MTLDDLRAIVIYVRTKRESLMSSVQDFETFVEVVWDAIKPENPFASTIDVDAFVAIQVPIYLAKLTAIETASDQFGTDLLH